MLQTTYLFSDVLDTELPAVFSSPSTAIADSNSSCICFRHFISLFDFERIVVTRFPTERSRLIAFLATDDSAWCSRRDSNNVISQKTKTKLVYTSVWRTRSFCTGIESETCLRVHWTPFLCLLYHSFEKSFCFCFKYRGVRLNIKLPVILFTTAIPDRTKIVAVFELPNINNNNNNMYTAEFSETHCLGDVA